LFKTPMPVDGVSLESSVHRQAAITAAGVPDAGVLA
jgi:hypothetical protein